MARFFMMINYTKYMCETTKVYQFLTLSSKFLTYFFIYLICDSINFYIGILLSNLTHPCICVYFIFLL